MSRIRSIKPDFWTSEQILECSRNARLLFIGLWNFCDDEGRHPYSPRQAKAEVFPGDDLSEAEVVAMLRELEDAKLICRYAVEGKQFFYVTGWKHQRIDKPQSPKYPDPFADNSKIVPRTLPPDRIGEDRIGRDKIFTRSRAKKIPIPTDWKPNEDHIRSAAHLKVDWRDVEQRFRDYLASTGRQYVDYDAAFRNFIKNAPKFNGVQNGKAGIIAAADSLIDRIQGWGSPGAIEIGGGSDAAAVRLLPKG